MEPLEYVIKLVESNSQKLDSLNDKVGSLEVISARQEANVKQHMKRSDLLEKKVDILENDIKPVLDNLRSIKILFAILSSLLIIAGVVDLIFKFHL